MPKLKGVIFHETLESEREKVVVSLQKRESEGRGLVFAESLFCAGHFAKLYTCFSKSTHHSCEIGSVIILILYEETEI